MSRRHWNDTSCHGVTGTMRFCLKPSHFLAELLGLVDYDIACPNWYDLLYLNGLNGFDREVDDWWGIRSTVGQVFDDCGQKVKTQKHVFFATTSQFGKDSGRIYHDISSHVIITCQRYVINKWANALVPPDRHPAAWCTGLSGVGFLAMSCRTASSVRWGPPHSKVLVRTNQFCQARALLSCGACDEGHGDSHQAKKGSLRNGISPSVGGSISRAMRPGHFLGPDQKFQHCQLKPQDFSTDLQDGGSPKLQGRKNGFCRVRRFWQHTNKHSCAHVFVEPHCWVMMKTFWAAQSGSRCGLQDTIDLVAMLGVKRFPEVREETFDTKHCR